MKLKRILAALTVALFAPLAASAATLTINGASMDFVDPAALGNVNIDVLETASVNVSFVEGDQGGTLVFSLNNVSASAAAFSIVGGTVNQGNNYGFAQGVDLWLDNPGNMIDLLGESFDFNTVIAAGGSALFNIEYGEPFGVGNVYPDIDFTVFAYEVPVPAAGFLLIGALGGLIALRRKA